MQSAIGEIEQVQLTLSYQCTERKQVLADNRTLCATQHVKDNHPANSIIHLEATEHLITIFPHLYEEENGRNDFTRFPKNVLCSVRLQLQFQVK